MSNYNSLKATINANIKTNGNQEITGSVLNSVLTAMVNTLGAGYMYGGVATPTTDPGSPDSKVFYLAAATGTYTNFGGLVVNDRESAILKWDTAWHKDSVGYATKADLDRLALVVGVTLDTNNNINVPFNVQAGKTYKITNNSEYIANVYFRIGKSSSGQVLVNVQAGGTTEFTPASNFDHIYVYSSTERSYSLFIRENNSLVERITAVESFDGTIANELKASATINSLAIGNGGNLAFPGYISTNWVINDNSGFMLFLVKPGDAVKIVANNTGAQFAYLKDFPVPVNGESPVFCNGQSRVQVNANATSETTAPADAKFLYVAKTIGGGNYSPAILEINGFDPFSKKSIREYLSDLLTSVEGINNTLIDGARITFNSSSTSRLVLDSPIVLSQNGDELEVSVTELVGLSSTGAYAFSNSGLGGSAGNSYYCIQLAKGYVGVRALDKTWLYQSKVISTNGHIVFKIVYADNKIYSYVNGTLIDTQDTQRLIRLASFADGGNAETHWSGTLNYVKHNGQFIPLYKQDIQNADVTMVYKFIERSQIENLDVYPKGVLKYDSTNKRFDFFSKIGKSNKYYSFRIRLDQDDSDLVYLKEWRLSNGKYWSYDGVEFTEIGETIFDAENEMAMKFASTSDYTGGVHGDERIDVSPLSFVKFFADGRLITDEEMSQDFTIFCASFAYMQLSTLHQTSATAGEYVSGHPIIAYHYKRNTFKDCSSDLENVIKMASEQRVSQYHAGMMCVGKGAGKYAILPGMVQTPELTGTSTYYNADDLSASRVDMWNPTTGARVSVDGVMLQGFNNDTDMTELQVWDRATDSKYYRRFVSSGSTRLFSSGSFIRNRQVVTFY